MPWAKHNRRHKDGPFKAFVLKELASKLRREADKNLRPWSACCGSAVMNPTSIREVVGWIPGLTKSVKGLAWL